MQFKLTAELVAQASVSGTGGEAALGEWIAAWLREHCADYPQVEHWTLDGLFGAAGTGKARPVAAFLPAPIESSHCVVLLGHYDTVGLEPYGDIAGLALDSAALKLHFAGSADEALREQAQSSDWAFGRGWLDMKGGVAAAMQAFVYFAHSRHADSHLLLLLTPDEEGQSSGIRSALSALALQLSSRGLQVSQVLNVDYCEPGPQFHPPLYGGTVGKLLLGLNVIGLPGHASEPFSAASASALAAALATGLEQSPRLAAQSGGEWLPPPSVLMLRDGRAQYDVTVPQTAQLYVNLLHLESSPERLWPRILTELRRILSAWDREQRRRYNHYCSMSNSRPPRQGARPELIDYPQLCERLGSTPGLPAPEALAAAADPAALLLDGLEAAALRLERRRPLVVASLLPPFYPAQLMQRGSPQEDGLRFFARAHHLPVRRAYPYISDMSFFSFDESSVHEWAALGPAFYSEAERRAFASLRAPVTNLGPQGHGAHSALERVHLPSLRLLLPKLIGLLIVLSHRDRS